MVNDSQINTIEIKSQINEENHNRDKSDIQPVTETNINSGKQSHMGDDFIRPKSKNNKENTNRYDQSAFSSKMAYDSRQELLKSNEYHVGYQDL